VAAKGRIVAALSLGLAILPSTTAVLAQPETSSADSLAVFDAPGTPGVRMMAPIPDKPNTIPTPVRKPSVPAKPASKVAEKVASTPDNTNRGLLAQAFATAGKNWNRTRLLAAESGSQIGRLIVEWRYLLDDFSGANFEAISAFVNEHPNWPRRDALIARAERTMPDDLDPRDVIAWFNAHPPVSGMGNVRLGAALMDTGKRAEGVALIRKGWFEFTFSPFDENRIAGTYANVIGPAEHRTRLLKQIARDDLGGAKRQMLRVDADTRRLANALIQLKASPATVKPLLASLPESIRNDPELMFEAARALRRRNQDQDAWALMAKTPERKDAMAAPERWSVERQIMARDALKTGKNELAYQLASTPALDADAGTTFMEAEFLAGWIALDFLHRPEVAHRHFDRLAKGVTYPISVARAHYWLARADEAMNKPVDAAAEYRIAAAYPAVFYGQLALANVADAPLLHMNVMASDPLPSDRAAFDADERVQAIRLLVDFNDRTTIRQFALAIATDTPDAQRLSMLEELVASTGDPALGVKVAKNASYADIYLQPYLHPVLPVPKYFGEAPEAALVLGLARQESEFDVNAVSVAGARGLMQLMPATAKRTASSKKLPYRPNDLNKADYNMQLGMATISEYLDHWEGSYVLAIASYNAGPTNVRNWVDTYGDPRDRSVDPIDWIESIPFPETRNYVERVLENLEVYRNRLNNSDQKLGIIADLYRPNPMSMTAIRQANSTLRSIGNPDAVVGGSANIPGASSAQ
jgi:soluble lytic murein transglycosylase